MEDRKQVPDHRGLNIYDLIAAGALSGILTRFLCQPLDVLKIRLQLQIEAKHSTESKYKGLSQAVRSIYLEEKLPAFWKGVIPAQFYSATFGAAQFLAFEVLKRKSEEVMGKSTLEHHVTSVNFLCGALSGGFALTCSFPFDVLRTRMACQGEPKVYKSSMSAAKTMLRTEGASSFFKGYIPAAISTIPASGARFAFFMTFEHWWDVLFQSDGETGLKVAVCGAGAGVTTRLAVHPLDLVKKRLQVQGFEAARESFGSVKKVRNFRHCFVEVVKNESVFGLYKGLLPSLLKSAFTVGGHFFFYDQAIVFIERFKRRFRMTE